MRRTLSSLIMVRPCGAILSVLKAISSSLVTFTESAARSEVSGSAFLALAIMMHLLMLSCHKPSARDTDWLPPRPISMNGAILIGLQCLNTTGAIVHWFTDVRLDAHSQFLSAVTPRPFFLPLDKLLKLRCGIIIFRSL